MDNRSVTKYIITRLRDIEASFGKTKLVKLLYLVDVEFYRLTSRKLTDFNWIFYYYGPYATTIDDILKQVDVDIPKEDTITSAGHRAVIFKVPRNLDSDFEESASSLEKSVVDSVLRDWGLEELNPLLSHVYFHTEPMKDANRGDQLDFSKIKRTAPTAGRPRPTGNRELQQRFLQIMKRRSFIDYESLDPKPRLDRVFIRGLASLENEERYIAPSGEVEIAEKVKEDLRNRSS